MQYLLDTGILLRWFDRTDVSHNACHDVLSRLLSERHAIYTTHQCLGEFWNVSTRPTSARGGYGHEPIRVERRLAFIERICRMLVFNDEVYTEWRKTLIRHAIRGTAVHDARIAAHMLYYRIDHLITLNKTDFLRYRNISVLGPVEFLVQ